MPKLQGIRCFTASVDANLLYIPVCKCIAIYFLFGYSIDSMVLQCCTLYMSRVVPFCLFCSRWFSILRYSIVAVAFTSEAHQLLCCQTCLNQKSQACVTGWSHIMTSCWSLNESRESQHQLQVGAGQMASDGRRNPLRGQLIRNFWRSNTPASIRTSNVVGCFITWISALFITLHYLNMHLKAVS
jgi:hypothetical protein